MPYSTSNPPSMISAGIGGTGVQLWEYRSTDQASDVDAPNYFSNFGALGGRVGDIIFSTDTDASPPLVTSHRVVTVSSTFPGAATISQGVSLSGATGA